MIALVAALAVLIGVALGLLGGGGSILAVPLLVYAAGQDPKVAIATSLVVVGATSAVAALGHARRGQVHWRTAGVFGAAGMVGAYLGGRLAAFVPATVLLVAFALLMGATAVAMVRDRRDRPPGDTTHARRWWRILLDGLVVGAVTGLLGAGGGFLVVPALVLLAGLPMPTAIGTSLAIIAMKSVTGLLGYLASTTIDWRLAGVVTLAAVLGSLVGGRFTGRVPEATLRRAFAGLVTATALFVLGEQAVASGLLGATEAGPWLALGLLLAAGAALVVLAVRPTLRGPGA